MPKKLTAKERVDGIVVAYNKNSEKLLHPYKFQWDLKTPKRQKNKSYILIRLHRMLTYQGEYSGDDTSHTSTVHVEAKSYRYSSPGLVLGTMYSRSMQSPVKGAFMHSYTTRMVK